MLMFSSNEASPEPCFSDLLPQLFIPLFFHSKPLHFCGHCLLLHFLLLPCFFFTLSLTMTEWYKEL